MAQVSAQSGARHYRRTLLALCLGAALVGTYIFRWASVSDQEMHRSDFMAFRDVAVIVRDGGAPRAYEFPLQVQANSASGGDRIGVLPFANPPAALLLVAPLAHLDVSTGYHLWSGLQLVLLLAAIAITTAAAPQPNRRSKLLIGATAALTLAAPPVYQNLIEGQWLGFIALGLAATYALWRGGHTGAAGAVLAFTLSTTKPHLGLGLAVWLLAVRNRRAIVAAVIGVAASLGAGVAIAGFAAIGGWLQLVASGSSPGRDWTIYLSVPSTVGAWLGGGTGGVLGGVLVGLALAVAIAAAGDRFRRGEVSVEGSLATAVLLTLAMAPHLWFHDLTLLAPVFVWLCASALTRDGSSPWPGTAFRSCLIAWGTIVVAGAIDGYALPERFGHISGLALVAIAWAGSRRRPIAGATRTRRLQSPPCVCVAGIR